SRAGAGVMAQCKSPENARQPEHNCRCSNQVKHQRKWLPKRFDEQTRGNIRNDHHWNDPAEDYLEQFRENNVRIPRDVEKIKISIDQSLRANDPETHCSQCEHDGVM